MLDSKSISKRQTAVKVRIKEIVKGKYIEEEGWQPNYIISDSGVSFSRVNVVGFVTSKSSSPSPYQSISLDDGTGKVSIREFENKLIKNVDVGDLVLFVGRPRKFQGSVYLVPEIVKKMDNLDWAQVRKKELGIEVKTEPAAALPIPIIGPNETDEKEIVCSLIRKMDSGSGVGFEEVVKNVNLPDAGQVLDNLLKNGDLFEVTPGRLKLLE